MKFVTTWHSVSHRGTIWRLPTYDTNFIIIWLHQRGCFWRDWRHLGDAFTGICVILGAVRIASNLWTFGCGYFGRAGCRLGIYKVLMSSSNVCLVLLRRHVGCWVFPVSRWDSCFVSMKKKKVRGGEASDYISRTPGSECRTENELFSQASSPCSHKILIH